jgi:hypothetical protein
LTIDVAAAVLLLAGLLLQLAGGVAGRRVPRWAPALLIAAGITTAIGIDVLALFSRRTGDVRSVWAAAVLNTIAAVGWVVLQIDAARGGRARGRRQLFLGYVVAAYVTLGLLGGWRVPAWPGWVLVGAGGVGLAALIVGGAPRRIAEAPGWLPLGAAFLGVSLLL